MKTLPALLFALTLSAQITVIKSPQSVTMQSPTPITCGAPGLQVTCTAPPPTITLPIEVFGSGVVSTTFLLPAAPPSTTVLWLQIHGLRYDSEASAQLNNSVWLPLSTTGVTLQGNAVAFGGIGGGFSTISMTVALPPGVVTAGTNTISFRFNGTDGISSGYRVLGFNLQSSAGNLLPAATFVYDDPAKWAPPLNDAADIAAGLAAFQTAPLSDPAGGAMVAIKAHCSDCHASDGRDLKYFNYSNLSIEQRAIFHGLSNLQGQQIASYIRSLTTPAPGRPWNPPYQPGPGLDSQPVANWSAGAGLAAVLANDAAMQAYLMPGGVTGGWAATAYLNPREMPVALMLPDWNSWLPIVHPMDSFGTSFTGSTLYADLALVRTALQSSANSTTAYTNAQQAFRNWYSAGATFSIANPAPAAMTAAQRQQWYSLGLWSMVKTWELNQTFGLEAIPQVPFGAKANPRGWQGVSPFYTAPNMAKVSAGPGLANGSAVVQPYLSQAWYQLQLILNDGQGTQAGSTPVDYGYVSGEIANISIAGGGPLIMLSTQWAIKAIQEFTLTGRSPAIGQLGWSPTQNNPGGNFTLSGRAPISAGTPAATIATLATALMQSWFNQAQTYTPAQWYQGGWASATYDAANINGWTTTFGGQIWYGLPRLRFVGVPASLTTQIAAWAATVWPVSNWALNNAATCTLLGLGACTSDQ
jgi:hypothetical protein